jgi:uncharacterized protein (TIGR03790 family)
MLLAGWLLAVQAHAGGSGLNTLLVVNQASANSCALGNYYSERRGLPPDNVLFINWAGGNTSWSSDQFLKTLLAPLTNALAARQLTNQIDYVVLSMDIPFQITYGSAYNSTTAALFYGLKPDGGTDWKGVTNSYAASEAVFRQARPASAAGYSFLATMLTGNSLAQAKRLVDQGVAGDGTFPTQRVLLEKTADPAYNVRSSYYDNAVFNTRVRGQGSLLRTNGDWLWGQTNLLGSQTGLSSLRVGSGAFVPGALADNLNSFGGLLFSANSQTTLLAFTEAGAAGSYGTVAEPSADPEKFPSPQNYFYQGRGFSLAECYYQSLAVPYLGLVVGEPLSAPFARGGSGSWSGLASNAVLIGRTHLAVSFLASDSSRPLQQVDLFVDGKFFRTLTNLAPCPGNVLTLAVNGVPVNYTVASNATPASIAGELTALLNAPEVTNLTQVAAFAHGDRVELRATSINSQAIPYYFADAAGSTGRAYRATYLPTSTPSQLSVVGLAQSGFHLQVQNPGGVPYRIEASTNLHDWAPIATNASGGPMDFMDGAAASYPRRFYRVVGTDPEQRPRLALPTFGAGGVKLHIDSPTPLPYALQVSTNLTDWTSLTTNAAGGAMDFQDPQAATLPARFYRALVWPPPTTNPVVTRVSTAGGASLLRVDGATRPYQIEVSTNQVRWSALYTNLAPGIAQVSAGSSAAGAEARTTFLLLNQGSFLNSPAEGFRPVTANGVFQTNSWLQLQVTKTNGLALTLGVTNQASGATLLDLAGQLENLVNSTPALQSADGLVAEDLGTGLGGAATFTVRARSPGQNAAGIQTQLSGSSRLVLTPKTPTSLDANLSDLQPRNHFYVAAGASRLSASFLLDTRTLADGFHELTAVAYEGSHVRTQTQVTLPVWVQNSSLTASLNWLDLPASAPVQGVYHLQVVANANNVAAIRLYSTGRLLGSSTGQPTATFAVNGASLGAGLHRFYAVVENTRGVQYRTQPQWVRLVQAP